MIKTYSSRKNIFLTAAIISLGIFFIIGILLHRAAKEDNLLNNISLSPNSLEKNKVLVKVKALKCYEALKILGCKLCKQGIQPVSVMINNKSGAVYYFGTKEIAPRCVRAQNLVPSCFSEKPNKGSLPIALKESATINLKKKNSYLSKELVDDFIYPQQVKKGFLFFSPFKKTGRLIIPLINGKTGEKITFEFSAN